MCQRNNRYFDNIAIFICNLGVFPGPFQFFEQLDAGHFFHLKEKTLMTRKDGSRFKSISVNEKRQKSAIGYRRNRYRRYSTENAKGNQRM
jgi:hypothetical protein